METVNKAHYADMNIVTLDYLEFEYQTDGLLQLIIHRQSLKVCFRKVVACINGLTMYDGHVIERKEMGNCVYQAKCNSHIDVIP